MKVFTVLGSANHRGAYVSKLPIYNKNESAIIVGSSENGCKLGVVKISGQYDSTELQSCFLVREGGKFTIQPLTSNKDDSKCLVVFRTHVYKGGKNFHTGDRKNCVCLTCHLEFGVLQETCTNCGKRLKVYFQDFPGEILAKGTIRDSKKPIFGEQLVAILKKNQVFRTAYDGFVYGKGGCHYHRFTGERIITCTWEERLKFQVF